MALLSLPVDLPLTVHVGIGLRRQFRWKPDGETGQDFTGWSARLLIGSRGQKALCELCTTPHGSGVVLDTDGVITLTLTPARSRTLPLGVHFYQLDLTPPEPDLPIRFLAGRLSVVAGLETPS